MFTNYLQTGIFTLFYKLIFQELMEQRIERKNGENCFPQVARVLKFLHGRKFWIYARITFQTKNFVHILFE